MRLFAATRSRVMSLVALALACEITGSLGKADPAASGDEGGSDATSGGSATDSATGASTVAEGEGGGGTADGSSTTLLSAEEHRADEDTGTVDHPGPCAFSAADDPCSACRKLSCCDALVVCHDAPHCLCAWECILATDHEPAMCSEQCEEDSSALTDLLACEQDACHQHCAAATDTGTSGA